MATDVAYKCGNMKLKVNKPCNSILLSVNLLNIKVQFGNCDHFMIFKEASQSLKKWLAMFSSVTFICFSLLGDMFFFLYGIFFQVNSHVYGTETTCTRFSQFGMISYFSCIRYYYDITVLFSCSVMH